MAVDYTRDTSVPVALLTSNVLPADSFNFVNFLINALNTVARAGTLTAYVPQYTIATLPASGNVVGTRAFVTNAQTTPVFGATPSSTGAVLAPVIAVSATAWVYG
jgi:hypothetical protein